MATRIQRIHAIWGETSRIDAEPDLRTIAPAVYRPASGGAPHHVVPIDEAGFPAQEPGDRGADADPDFSCARLPTAPDGLYIPIDRMTHHYGHFIVDILSRLWPLAGRVAGPVWLVCEPATGRAYWERYPFLGEMLAGLGLTVDVVVSFEEPVVLPRVMIPEPSFRSLHSVHGVFGELCQAVGRRYWSETEVDTVKTPVYLSKSRLSTGIQRLVNEADLVDELARLGVDILFPEELTFAEQVRQFAQRRVVMGINGSAFHTAPFSARGRRTIALSGMLHLHANHIMFDAINDNRSYYYFTPGTTSFAEAGFDVGWLIPDPRQVAAQMVARAENIDRIELYDAAVEAEAARQGRSIAGRLRRLRRGLTTRWSRG